MKTLLAIAALAVLAGCGLESVGTAAQIKKRELEAAQANQKNAQQKIDAAVQQMNERAAKPAAD